LTAGGDLVSQAGRDTTIVASKISAGNEAYLYSGDKLSLLAAENSTHTLYDMKKKGGWGAKETKRDEVTRVTNVGTEIKTGSDLSLVSGGDQTYQLAKLQSGKDITLDSGGAITLEAVKDLHQESHEKSNNNAFWVSSKGKGNTDETVRQSQLIAQSQTVIQAVNGLKIDVKQVNQQTVSQTIDTMVKADPQLAWIKDAEKRGDVDWRQVKEIHDSFKYSNSGLGPASQIIIAIFMAAVVGPLAAAAAGGGTVGAVAGAVAAGASTNATVSVFNNRGNLGAVLKDVTSSDAMKGYVIAGATAGLTAEYFGDWTGTETNTATGKITTPGILNSWSGVGQFAANQTLQSGTSMLLSKAFGQRGSASDALKNALFNTLAAASFNSLGNYTKNLFADGSAPKIAIHAMVGGLLAEATGGDFKTGALAAGASEALVTHLDSLVKGDDNLLTMSSQIVGVLAAAAQGDVDASTLEKGSWIAQNGTQYNYLNHNQLERAAKKIAGCTDTSCIEDTTRKFKELSLQQDIDAIAGCKADPSTCAARSKEVANTIADLNPIKDIVEYGSPKAREAVQNLINSNFEFQEMLAAATTEHTVGAMVDTLKAKWNLSDAQAKDITDGLKVALAVGLGTAAGALAYKRAIAASKRESPASSRPDVLPPESGKNVWDLEPRARGRQIETTLTDTDYKDWARTDDLINPKTGQPFKSNNFPVIDFQLDTNVVSLKTIDTRGKGWSYDMRTHIDTLQSSKITVDGVPATKILDIRVQPGGSADANKLIEYGRQRNITVIIKEFGG